MSQNELDYIKIVSENASFNELQKVANLFVIQIRNDIEEGGCDSSISYGLAIPCDHDKKNECNIGLFMEFLKEELNKYYKEWLTSITCKYRQYHWEIIVEIHKGVPEI